MPPPAKRQPLPRDPELGAGAEPSAPIELARSGATPIFLGGDHRLSMGSINGVARHWHEQGRELFVLWLDAHADYNTPHDDA